MPIAVNTEDANMQHYEVPSEFFKLVLGKHLKYRCLQLIQAFLCFVVWILVPPKLNGWSTFGDGNGGAKAVERSAVAESWAQVIPDLECGSLYYWEVRKGYVIDEKHCHFSLLLWCCSWADRVQFRKDKEQQEPVKRQQEKRRCIDQYECYGEAKVNFWIFELLGRAYVRDVNNQLHSTKLVLEEPSMRSKDLEVILYVDTEYLATIAFVTPFWCRVEAMHKIVIDSTFKMNALRSTHPYNGDEAHNIFNFIDTAFEPTGVLVDKAIAFVQYDTSREQPSWWLSYKTRVQKLKGESRSQVQHWFDLEKWELANVCVNAPLEEIAWLEPEDEMVLEEDPLSNSDESYHACKEAMEKLSSDVMTLLGEHRDNGKFVSKLRSCIRRLEKDVATCFRFLRQRTQQGTWSTKGPTDLLR
ncbi:hypothetical protein R1flu_016178 [Riccia fluitans]|uniref:Uncharacterized protein n=1 Tax=Riccia fluitans TaxID=41844 RepID=A0ABD1YPY5_9MARC